jgi:EpsI family protein
MKNYIATSLILLVAAVVHLGISRAQDRAALDKPEESVVEIPSTIGPFQQVGPDIPVEPYVQNLLQTSTILQRQYVTPAGLPVFLSIVYAGKTRRSMHFPEVCLVGHGWEVREQTTLPVGFFFSAKKLVLVKGGRKEGVLYWFKTGDNLSGNFFVNSWQWARTVMTHGSATSAMIRLSAPLPATREEAVFDVLADFAAKLTPILMERVK